jgi:hypothetical protein
VSVQLGNVIAANIYVASDKPLYHAGNTHLIIINVLVIFLFLFTKVYYVTRNRLRDKKWNSMSTEVGHLLSTTVCLEMVKETNQRNTIGEGPLSQHHTRQGQQEAGFPVCSLDACS